MKKWTKKALSLLLALTMLFALAVPAMAAEEEDVVISDAEFKAMLQEIINDEITEKGGVPGQVNVMVNGKCLSFPDTPPKIVDSRTMIPIRAVTEGLGMIVDWDSASKVVTIIRQDVDFSVVIPIGSKEITVYHGEDVSTMTMDCAAYIDGGRTMVPIRFLSEALGYTVLWDKEYRTVVILDKDSIISEMNKDFSKINEAIAREAKMMAEKDNANYVSASFNGTATIARVLTDGDSDDVYSVGGDLTSYVDNNGNIRVDLKFDAASVIQAILDDPAILGDSESKLNVKAAAELIKNGLTMSMLVMKDGTIYINVPMLSYILEDFPENTWFKITDVVTDDLMNLALTKEEDMTVGSIVFAMLATDTGAFHFYDTLSMIQTYLPLFFGDNLVKEEGGVTSWVADEGDLRALLDMDNTDRAEFALSVNEKGESAFSFTTITDFFGDASLILMLGVTGNNAKDNSTADMRVSLTNVGSLSLTYKTTSETKKNVESIALPAGAQEVDLGSLADAIGDLAAQ